MDREFDDFKQRVREHSPLLDLVLERVPKLRRSGALWAACCPFHEEKSPSFKVDPRSGHWRCYGRCAEGGDVFSFVMRFDGLAFRDALELLAKRAGLELPRRGAGARERESKLAPLFAALEAAQEHFARELWSHSGAAARATLTHKGLSEATLRSFGVGLAPDHGPFGARASAAIARAAKVDEAALVDAGLVRRTEDGRSYDFFRGRLTIPIRDSYGRVVGFGARVIDGSPHAPRAPHANDAPKYINTPETPVFHKGRLVFGYDRALGHARSSRHLVLTEGYTDVMACHQIGLTGAVAVMGTALTAEHAALVRRSGARRVTLFFDGDAAGRQAALKSLPALLPLELALDVAVCPDGLDPGDLVARGEGERLLACVAAARDWFAWLVEGARAASGEARIHAVRELLVVLAPLSPVARETRLAELAQALEMPVGALRQEWDEGPGRARRADGAPRAAAPSPAPPAESSGGSAEPALTPLERRAWIQLAAALLLDLTLIPEHAERLAQCPDGELRVLFRAIAETWDAAEEQDFAAPGRFLELVLDRLADHPVRRRLIPWVEDFRPAESPRHLALEACEALARATAARSLDAARRTGELDPGRLNDLHENLRATHIGARRLRAVRPAGPGGPAGAVQHL